LIIIIIIILIFLWNNLALADSNGLEILTLYCLLTISSSKVIVVPLWTLLVSVFPLRKLETFPTLTATMSQDLALLT
jgi:hypothetical protein